MKKMIYEDKRQITTRQHAKNEETVRLTKNHYEMVNQLISENHEIINLRKKNDELKNDLRT